jgi:hypothetical protein
LSNAGEDARPEPFAFLDHLSGAEKVSLIVFGEGHVTLPIGHRDITRHTA